MFQQPKSSISLYVELLGWAPPPPPASLWPPFYGLHDTLMFLSCNFLPRYYTPPLNESRRFNSYYDNATKGFLANVAAGRKWPKTGDGDDETNAVAHVLPVVVMRAGKPSFLQDAEAAIRIVQDNDDAVAFGLTFARILERVILGDAIVDAVKVTAATLRAGTGNPNDAWFAHGLAKMDEWSPRPPIDVTLEIGQGCDFPFHVFTAPHLLLHYNGSVGFAQAVRETILLGGENANRGTFIASILAAAAGSVDAAVPKDWLARTTRGQEVMMLAEQLADGGNHMMQGRSASEPTVASARGNAPIESFNSIQIHQQGRGVLSVDNDVVSPHTAALSRGSPHAENVAVATPPARSGPKRVMRAELRNSPGCIANANHTTSNATRPPSHPDDIAGLRALYLATGGPQWYVCLLVRSGYSSALPVRHCSHCCSRSY